MIKLVCTKMKDAEPPRNMTFALKSVDLGGGASSAALELAEACTTKERQLTKVQKLARDAYIDAAAVNGILTADGFTGLHLDHWRADFYAKHTGDTIDAKRKAFGRVRQDLQSAGLISAENDVYLWRDSAVALSIMFQRKGGTSGTVPDNPPECPDAEAGMSGTDRTHPYRGVPCPAPSGVDDDGQTCTSCAGVGCAWCEQ